MARQKTRNQKRVLQSEQMVLFKKRRRFPVGLCQLLLRALHENTAQQTTQFKEIAQCD